MLGCCVMGVGVGWRGRLALVQKETSLQFLSLPLGKEGWGLQGKGTPVSLPLPSIHFPKLGSLFKSESLDLLSHLFLFCTFSPPSSCP